NYVAMTKGSEPVLFVQSHNHVPNAREASSIRTERGGLDSAVTVAHHFIAAGGRHRAVGCVRGIPGEPYLPLQRELAGCEFKDVTGAFRRLRLVKSTEEIEWLRHGAALTDLALMSLVENAKPGMREHQLGALIEAIGLTHGGLPHLCYLSSGPQDG